MPTANSKINEDNKFIKRLQNEFEGHIVDIFGCTFQEYLDIIPGGADKLKEDCQHAFEQGGMAGLRYMMKSSIAVLDFIYFMETEDKEWGFEDFVQRATSLNIGIRRDELVPWTWPSMNNKNGVVQKAVNDVK
jgi:hypothetical protein